MLERKDYILREIERVGIIFARLRDRILGRTASLPEVRRDLYAAAASVGFDLALAHDVSLETLLMLAPPDLDPTRCWIVAESCYLQGLELHLCGDIAAAENLLRRARLLYDALGGGWAVTQLPDAAQRIREIDALLAQYPDAA